MKMNVYILCQTRLELGIFFLANAPDFCLRRCFRLLSAY